MECDECEGVKTLELHTPITASLQITKAEDDIISDCLCQTSDIQIEKSVRFSFQSRQDIYGSPSLCFFLSPREHSKHVQLRPNYSYTRCPNIHTHTLSAHLCSISYLHATVALLTADETLAPFHTPPRFVPPPLLFPSLIFLCIYYSELQEALLFSADGEQFIKQRGHQKLTPQASRSLFYPLPL